MDRPYEPIDCGFHDRLLHLATLRQVCSLVYRGEDGRRETIQDRIADVYSRGGAEYLSLEGGLVLRLDAIRSVDGLEIPGSG